MTTKKRKFVYRPLDKAAVKKHSEKRGGAFDSYIKSDLPRYAMKDGMNRIRILPPTWDDAHYFGLEIKVNYDIGVDGCSYVSPSSMGQKDPIAEERQIAVRQGDKKYADKLKPRVRVLYWVIDRDNEEDGPVVMDAPRTLDADISSCLFDPDDGSLLNIDHPDEGYDVTFRREGQGLKTQYRNVTIARKSSPITDDQDQYQDWMDLVVENPLPDVLNTYDYEYLKKVMEGTAKVDSRRDEEEDDDEAEERPRKRKGSDAMARLRKLRKEREADDDEDEDDDPPPRRRPTKRVPAKPKRDADGDPLDEDEEPLDEDDSDFYDDSEDGEDDDPPPRRRPTRGRSRPARASRRTRPADEDDDEDLPE